MLKQVYSDQTLTGEEYNISSCAHRPGPRVPYQNLHHEARTLSWYLSGYTSGCGAVGHPDILQGNTISDIEYVGISKA